MASPTDAPPAQKNDRYDVIIVGGGPAGLNAALILGRCRRRVLLVDSGKPRNAVSPGVHGFLTRDGTLPAEMRRIAREQLRPYPNVEVRDGEICEAKCHGDWFEVRGAGGERFASRKLLLATGLLDDLPDIPGFAELYGSGVFNCPYCDGWENRDRPIAVYGPGERCVGLALEMTLWSRDMVLLTDGPADIPDGNRARLDAQGIRIVEEKVARLEGDGRLERIHFEGREPLEREAIFLNYGEREGSELARMVGCELTNGGTVETRSYERTDVPGLYVAGDASRRVQFAIVAAGEGAMAAFAINNEMLKEDLPRD
ncbi:MAG TPA: NAD(P)/FAD-dependent oxidoreductase [Beijerinckiaceae bacterium]|jgi:thioredoxin reductase